MKIAFIGTVISSTLNFRKSLIKALLAKQHEVFIFAVDYTKESKEDVISIGAYPVDFSLNRSGLNPIKDIISTYQLYLKIRKLNCDTVFLYFPKPIIFGSLAAKYAGTKKIIGMLEGLGQGFTDFGREPTFKEKLVKFIQTHLYKKNLPKLDHLIFLNSDDKKEINAIVKTKSIHLLDGIGINLKDFPYSYSSPHPLRFLYIGRLIPEKGIIELLEAMEFINKKYPHVFLDIVGSFDKNFNLDIKKNLLNGSIKFHGQQNCVKGYLKEASVFVLPSYREGLSRSVQEAMAMGRPIITTNVPGCRATVIDGMNGFLVPPFDSKSLAEKMIYFIENPDLIEKMGKESHRMAVERFDEKKANAKLIELIEA